MSFVLKPWHISSQNHFVPDGQLCLQQTSCFILFCCACSELITVNYVSLTAEGQFESLNQKGIQFRLCLLFPIGLQNARSRCQQILLGFSLTEPRHDSHHEPHSPAGMGRGEISTPSQLQQSGSLNRARSDQIPLR